MCHFAGYLLLVEADLIEDGIVEQSAGCVGKMGKSSQIFELEELAVRLSEFPAAQPAQSSG